MHKKYLFIFIGVILGSTIYTYMRTTKMPEGNSQPQLISHERGLKSLVLKAAPEGAALVKPGTMVKVHYTGWLYDENAADLKGRKFDSSVDRGQPFQFKLGAGMVIQGWDKGVALMKVGEKRRFIIPASLGYGSHGAGAAIPPNATLVFDVEVL